MESKTTSINFSGIDLFYSVEGSGIPLLIVGSATYYPRTFSQQLKQSFTLVYVDLPHFVPLGDDFSEALISFDSYASCIEAVRVNADLDEIVVVGHSHHGNIALEYAKRYPDHVSHVVMIGSPPVNIANTVKESENYWSEHATNERKTTLERRRTAVDEKNAALMSPMEAYVSHYVADAPLYWNNPHYDASWLWEGMQFNMNAVKAFRNLYQDYELSRDNIPTSIPLLVIMGEQDYAVPHTLWHAILPTLKNITFHVLKHSGHTPQLEQSEAFDKILIDWIIDRNTTDKV